MREYARKEYARREDGKIVITERCINPHWDAMPGEFDMVFLYDPVKAEQAKDWQPVWSFKTRNGRRTWMYQLIGIGMWIGGLIGDILIIKTQPPPPSPPSIWFLIFILIMVVGLVIIIGRWIYVGNKICPIECLKCSFPEDPGAF